MKLYVCWGTFPTPRPGGHACANAYGALRDAGHDPEVVKSYGFAPLPAFLNQTRGRRGNPWHASECGCGGQARWSRRRSP